jgi:chemotaxis signal transduction protein
MPVRLEHQWVLVDASAIVEVLGSQQWLVVPQASGVLPGVCAWRGRAVAVLDLPRMLGLLDGQRAPSPRTLILQTQSGKLAVPVNEARAVVVLEESRLNPVHATSLPYMRAEVDDGATLTPVLDIASIVGALMSEQTVGSTT